MSGVSEPTDLRLLFACQNTGSGMPKEVLELRSFALYVLSRGNGVSEEGRKALSDFRKLVDMMQEKGEIDEVSDTRIGIEGDTRICARFATPNGAAKAWMDMQRLLPSGDLVQLKAEKC